MNLFKLKISILIVSISLSTTFHLSSQNNPDYSCGTTISEESLEFYNSIRSEITKNEKSFMAKSSSTKGAHDIKVEYIPIKAHIIRTSKGNDGLQEDALNEAIDNLNAIYKDLYIQFSIVNDINYINNDSFCYFNKNNESELIKNNYSEGALNIYFVNNLENESKNSICGYANVSIKRNIILMKNSCVTNDSSLAHEIGHILSLMHTHGPNDNMTTELVNGSNCDTDGDGICDTPADPKLDSKNVDNFCNYIGTEKDANGDTYQPDTKNIMSYSYKGCRTQFSKQQQVRMYAFFQYIKMQFSGAIAEDVKETSLAQIKIYPNPVSNGTINISSSIDTATYYQISNFYGQVLSQGPLTNKQIDVNNLSSGTYLLTLNNGNSRVVKKFIK